MNLFHPDSPSAADDSARLTPLRPRRNLWRRAAVLGAGILLLWLSLQFLPAQHATSSEAASTEPYSASPENGRSLSLLRPGTVAAFLLLAGGGVLAVYLRRRRPTPEAGNALLTTLGTLHLAGGHRLQLVRCGESVLLLGITGERIELLRAFSEEDFKEEIADSTEPSTAGSMNGHSHFASLLQHAGFSHSNGHTHSS